MNIQFTDRYQALGIPYPDPQTMCNGQCEGTGVYPMYLSEFDKRENPKAVLGDTPHTTTEREAWMKCHNESTHADDNGVCDGWHFIKCPDCGGTGKK